MSGADENRITIAAAGAVPPLIALLASSSVEVQRAAAGALCNLAGNSTNAGPTCIIMRRTFACCAGEVETQIAASGAIAPLIALLASPSSEIQLAAAWALRNLAENGAPCNACHGGLFVLPRVVAHEHRVSSCAADQNKILIELAGAVPPLVSLLKSPSVALQRPAAEALNALASSGVCAHADASSMLVRLVLSNNNTLPHADTVKISIAAAGAVPPIIAMLSSPLIELHRVAAWLLRNLTVNGTRAADLPRRCG